MSPSEIKDLMQKYGIAPKKLFGQNFIISEGILDKIVASADLSKNDIVLEVGPGLGALTFKLAPLVKKILAVEKDRNLVKILHERLAEKNIKNVEIIEQDILIFNPSSYQLTANSYNLIANIPYYLTSALIRKFLESKNRPRKMILMIQKEVAQRICAPKYDEKMNLLALSVQFYADAKILFYVSKNNFWPAPKVDSTVIEITPRATARGADPQIFFKIARAGFASRRKQLASNLAKNLSLRGTKQSQQKLCQHEIAAPSARNDNKKENRNDRKEGSCNDRKQNSKEKIEKILQGIGLDAKSRAEDLKLEDWIKLTKIWIFHIN